MTTVQDAAGIPQAGTAPVVFVVDDDVSVRESLKPLLESQGWEARTFDSGRGFLDAATESRPSCLVLDLGLPDLSGLDLQDLVAGERAEMPIIFITGYGDVPSSVRAMKAGAVEFLTKPFQPDVLVEAVRGALDVSRATLAEKLDVQAVEDRYATLTARERQVMARVVAGLLNKQIAYELGLSEITVKVHRGRVMHKMAARSVADLVRMGGKLARSVEQSADEWEGPLSATPERTH